jgi:hypothetical protein
MVQLAHFGHRRVSKIEDERMPEHLGQMQVQNVKPPAVVQCSRIALDHRLADVNGLPVALDRTAEIPDIALCVAEIGQKDRKCAPRRRERLTRKPRTQLPHCSRRLWTASDD